MSTSDAPSARPRRTRRRRARLARPRAQLLAALASLGWAAGAVAGQFALVGSAGGSDARSVGLAFGLTGAACVLAVLTATQRFAGPLRRFERYFEGLARGQDPGPCRLRRRDAEHELCALVNRVTAGLRAGGASPGEVAPEGEAPAQAPVAPAAAAVPAELRPAQRVRTGA